MVTCKICGVESDSFDHEIEHILIEMIKKENPQWIESDGACSKCINHYSDLDDTVVVYD